MICLRLTFILINDIMKYELNSDLDKCFGALADPIRRAIIKRLARGDAYVGDIVEMFDISAPAISRHLKVLEETGLIEREVDAQFRRLRFRREGFGLPLEWFEDMGDFWRASLDRLKQHLVESEEQAHD